MNYSITTEHHSPIGKKDYISQQHIARYYFAKKELVPKQKVLDIACGSGYGTKILLEHGCEVIGADYNKELIDYLRQKSSDVFIYANALDLPFNDNIFDAVVSFETIEHVNDGNLFLKEMKRVLKPGGLFICSTPNICYTVHPPYHVKEYYPEEFYQLLSKYFTDIERYTQYFRLSQRIIDLINWRIRPKVVKSIESLGMKNLLKHLINQRQVSSFDNSASNYENALEVAYFESQYAVKPLVSVSGLMRIMVATGRKENQ